MLCFKIHNITLTLVTTIKARQRNNDKNKTYSKHAGDLEYFRLTITVVPKLTQELVPVSSPTPGHLTLVQLHRTRYTCIGI